MIECNFTFANEKWNKISRNALFIFQNIYNQKYILEYSNEFASSCFLFFFLFR